MPRLFLWRKSCNVAWKKACFPYIFKSQKAGRQSFKTYAHSPMRRHPAFVSRKVTFKIGGVKPLAPHFFHLLFITVYTQPSRRDLHTSEKQVKTLGQRGIVGTVHGVKWTFGLRQNHYPSAFLLPGTKPFPHRVQNHFYLLTHIPALGQ